MRELTGGGETTIENRAEALLCGLDSAPGLCVEYRSRFCLDETGQSTGFVSGISDSLCAPVLGGPSQSILFNTDGALSSVLGISD